MGALKIAAILVPLAGLGAGCHHYYHDPHSPGHRAVVGGLIGAGVGTAAAAVTGGRLGVGAAVGGAIGAITGALTTPPHYPRRDYYYDDDPEW